MDHILSGVITVCVEAEIDRLDLDFFGRAVLLSARRLRCARSYAQRPARFLGRSSKLNRELLARRRRGRHSGAAVKVRAHSFDKPCVCC